MAHSHGVTPATIIVAACANNGIGKGGTLPWKLSKEMQYFAKATKANPAGKKNGVLMGRKTWTSIPPKFRPLKERVNFVVSRSIDSVESDKGTVCESLTSAAEKMAVDLDPEARCYVIGGAQLYNETVLSSTLPLYINRVLLTRVDSDFECDVFFPDIASLGFSRASHEALQQWLGFDVAEGLQHENGVSYEFQMWTREMPN